MSNEEMIIEAMDQQRLDMLIGYSEQSLFDDSSDVPIEVDYTCQF